MALSDQEKPNLTKIDQDESDIIQTQYHHTYPNLTTNYQIITWRDVIRTTNNNQNR